MPLKYFLLVFLVIMPQFSMGWLFNFNTKPAKPFVIMIEASGDTACPGRTIGNSFESSVTLAIAQELKHHLEQLQSIKIIINRTANQKIEPLQNANMANKLAVDLYISVNVYGQKESKPTLFIYQFSYNDDYIIRENELSFHSFDKIYLVNQKKTTLWAKKIYDYLEKDRVFTLQGIYKIPFEPLIGIKPPALAFELGLQEPLDWHSCINALAQSITFLINNY